MPSSRDREDVFEAGLTSREQTDGRKVACLLGGEVVLVNPDDLDKVGDGEALHASRG